MGKEIELKIPLSDLQYDEIYKKYFYDSKMIYKRDEYFTKFDSLEERVEKGEPAVIRIRTESFENEKSKAFFTIKRKSVKDGVEINSEDETFIEDVQVLREFFDIAGYYCWFDKEKKAFSCYRKINSLAQIDFHMELVIVNDMKYLEIEVTDDKGLDNSVIQRGLEVLVLEEGLDPQKKDSRSWYNIIMDSKK